MIPSTSFFPSSKKNSASNFVAIDNQKKKIIIYAFFPSFNHPHAHTHTNSINNHYECVKMAIIGCREKKRPRTLLQFDQSNGSNKKNSFHTNHFDPCEKKVKKGSRFFSILRLCHKNMVIDQKKKK